MRTIRIRQKDCVDCGEKISRDAKRCPYCTSYQDGSTQFHATIGQFAILIAFCVSAYAAYLAAEANRLATAGHIAPTLTRLELNKEALTLDIYNTGNLRDHLKRVAIEGIGFVSASSVNDSVDQYREAHGVIDFDFGRTEKRIDARDSTTAILELGTATRFSVDASYKKMDEAAHVSSFFVERNGRVGECSASMFFVDPHGEVGSRHTVSPSIDCRIFTKLIMRFRS